MFFEKDILSFNILDVIRLNQKSVNTYNSERNFNALSFRLKSDAVLKTQIQEYHIKDHCICYVPARLNYKRVANVDELIVIHFDTIDYNTHQIECFMPKDITVFSKLFEQIFECWNKKECGYKYKCSAILYNIFAECHIQNFVAKPNDSKITNSVNYILKNYTEKNLTIKEIAEKSFMSEVYFRKLFKKEYGIPPQKFIINLRIQNAIGLISTGYYSLTDVAFASGYNDYKYFSTEFKKIIGISPSKYIYNYK